MPDISTDVRRVKLEMLLLEPTFAQCPTNTNSSCVFITRLGLQVFLLLEPCGIDVCTDHQNGW
jgi:hypothetical protein